jgi:lambda repressor-like predicted transcriptional regulator
VAEEKNNKVVTREFLHERDMRIFKLRQAGTSTTEIARRFGISTSSVSKAIQRQLEKMNRETLLAYPEVLRLELERLDNLQQAIWPMTQHRRQVMDDGTEVALEPDLKAIQQVLSIMDRRTKLLGMDQTNISVQMDVANKATETIKATLAGDESLKQIGNSFDPESEARQLLQLMGVSGVLPEDAVRKMLELNDEIIDAEIVTEEIGEIDTGETSNG